MAADRESSFPTRVYLGLGTNLGERRQNLRSAQAALAPFLQVTRASLVYQTPPWGYTNQPAFLNQVLEGSTYLAPSDLLARLKSTEVQLGRIATFQYGPRLIDIDILFYGSQQVDSPNLVIPHPRLAERAFMLVPLAELAPDLLYPALGLSVRQLLERVDRSGVEVYRD
jgi:2-amino-4-hydroxy-6-hydroxymethyldihydropteridine diphosphokinase